MHNGLMKKAMGRLISFFKCCVILGGAAGTLFSLYFLYLNSIRSLYFLSQALFDGGFTKNLIFSTLAEKTIDDKFILFRSLHSIAETIYSKMCIDFSSVTPFLLALSFGTFTWYSIMQTFFPGKNQIYCWENYPRLPFRMKYENFYIQMGLLGTLWGFVLIGFRMTGIDPASVKTLRIIVDGFGTAIWSTLMAVFLCYVVHPACSFCWRLVYRPGKPLKEVASLNNFRDALQKVTKELTDCSPSLEKISPTLRTMADSLSTIQKMLADPDSSPYIKELKKLNRTAEAISDDLDLLTKIKPEETQKTIASIESAVKTLDKNIAGAMLNNQEKQLAELKGLPGAVKKEFEAAWAEINKVLNKQLHIIDAAASAVLVDFRAMKQLRGRLALNLAILRKIKQRVFKVASAEEVADAVDSNFEDMENRMESISSKIETILLLSKKKKRDTGHE